MRAKVSAAVGFAAVLSVFVGVAATPVPAEPDPLAVLGAAAPEAVANAAQVATSDTGANAVDATVAGTEVVVPVDPAAGISMGGAAASVSIGLPFAAQADDATVQKPGVVSYDNNNGTATVPAVQDDGSVQINTIIDNAAAPTRFEYPITVPKGGRVTQSGDAIGILDAQERLVTVIAAPWAKDANGESVPTHFELSGDTVTQVVDHRSSKVAYPVVADPKVIWYWWGYAAKFSKAETKQIAGYSSVSGAVSLLCSWVPGGAPTAACVAAAFVFSQILMAPFRSAASHGRCGQINVPYVPGVPPLAYEVTC